MSSFTKSGFSRDFGCCSNWNLCNMGKKTCVYYETDPETMESCAAWRRVQNKTSHIETVSLTYQEKVNELDRAIIVKEQLTLF